MGIVLIYLDETSIRQVSNVDLFLLYAYYIYSFIEYLFAEQLFSPRYGLARGN